MHFCGSGLMGPMVNGLATYRIASYIYSLQGTVASALGGRRLPRLKYEKVIPEVYSTLNPRVTGSASLAPENVHNLMARLMGAWEG